MPGYIEVRDKGIIKKKVRIKGKSFDEIKRELEVFMRYNDKVLAPGILDDTLIQIGVPETKQVISQSPTEDGKAEDKDQQDKTEEPIEIPTIEAESIETEPADDSKLESTDLEGFEEALSAVEDISDKFLSSDSNNNDVKAAKIKVSLSGKSSIRASSKSVPSEIGTKNDSEVAEAESEAELDNEDQDLSMEKEEKTKKTPDHVIKPLVETKAIILGEEGVGKGSLIRNAHLSPEVYDDDAEIVEPYAYSKVYELSEYRVKENVWLFDKAADLNISRNEYYSNAKIVIIVYSVVDRWSFDSIEFWLKEASMHFEEQPPIVIVGNKKDLRTEDNATEIDDVEETAVSPDEGFKLAEEMAMKLGSQDKLHPVAFIETSCLTGEGVDAVFRTAAELFEGTL